MESTHDYPVFDEYLIESNLENPLGWFAIEHDRDNLHGHEDEEQILAEGPTNPLYLETCEKWLKECRVSDPNHFGGIQYRLEVRGDSLWAVKVSTEEMEFEFF